ncbi:hypothetical protein [Cupriavidus sp. D39]|uniref:hypothetical protein n=1 Tax=Cupriavidus sp. D39 TaxID=2997877 RepID=UPI002271E1AF|nr:hypothetical protein [Cupriavidus sp. D39]MCY0852696.1 hypothetical protein [Cupriavidus sp. D39]
MNISPMAWDQVANLVTVSVFSVIAGAMLGGFIYSLTKNVWEHVGEVLAQKINAANQRKVRELSARVWREKRGL